MVHGSFHAFWLFDVAESIDVERLRERFGQSMQVRSPQFRRPAPEYVRFERPPVFHVAPAMRLASGEEISVTLKYFDYGVVSVEMESRFALEWPALADRSQRWTGSPEIEMLAREAAATAVKDAAESLAKPAGSWMAEDYYVVHLREAGGVSAAELITRNRSEIAQIVRGESTPLSEAEQNEVLRGSISYYPNDLLIVGWIGALIYDTPQGAAPTLQILEYTNTQLLEFRFYDDSLTRLLADAYRRLETQRGVFARWRFARDAQQLNTMRLDVVELSERTDNALKFLGDMYYARAYRLAADRIGVNDYRKLVDEKLSTARELYDFMVNEFHHFRAYILELAVVIILIIDLYFILREAKVF